MEYFKKELFDNEHCNMCGKGLGFWDKQNNFNICKPYIGYGSAHDGDAIMMMLCCECADAIIGKCVISPIIECA